MGAQVFGVEAFKAAARGGAQHVGGMHQFAAREYVILDEFGDAAADAAASGLGRGDAVVEHQAAGFQQRSDLVEIGGEVETATCSNMPTLAILS